MSIFLCTVLILVANSTGLAKLFVVEVDGMKVVVDFWVEEEQAWQYTVKGEVGWWDGVAPHPYEFKVWYPYLSDAFDMTLDQQLGLIDQLEWAGITDWRIGYFWDTVPLKASMFRGLHLEGPNRLSNFNSDVYFPPTACGIGLAGTEGCIVLGRTGNEDGLVTGAIINPWEFYPGHAFPPPPPPTNGMLMKVLLQK